MSGEPQQVMKRNGRLQAFDAGKIAQALAQAGCASGEFGADEAQHLARSGVLPR
jgi:ribonucleoside-triphosphate reductase